MLKLSATLLNQPVMSLRLGGQIAHAVAPIINPHNLKIMGWWCREPGHAQPMVLLSEDVRDFTPQGLAVNNEDALTLPEDLVRHKEILDIKFDLIGKPVKTRSSRVGKIVDYSYNEGLFVQKLYVTPPVVKILAANQQLVIDRTQILEITDRYILVRDTEARETADEFANAAAAA